MAKKKLIFDLDLSEFETLMHGWGEPDFRSRQLWNGLYKNLWSDPDKFSIFSTSLRERLAQYFSFQNLEPVSVLDSNDGETRKTLFLLPDKHAIEAVLMRYKNRRTLCISTQAGCAMGCVFCATGQMGFQRNLSSGEIVEQVLFYARHLVRLDERVTNVVLMGMGEPFHNYEATLQAIDRLNHPLGINLGARRFTISTVGLIPAIQRFTAENRQINLAISLHAADDVLRLSMLPINSRYPLHDLIQACLEYVQTTNRRISFEWALIHGVNDSSDQATKLADLLQVFYSFGAVLCHVNVILLNPTQKYQGRAADHSSAQQFQSILQDRGIPCTIRLRRGIDIQAGCGQLAARPLAE